MSNFYHGNLENQTKANRNYRKVLYTGKYMQLVLMSLKPGEEIGEEVHDGHDQFFRVDSGSVMVIIDGVESMLLDGDAIVVPSGSKHNVINTSESTECKLYTIYAPGEHPDGLVQEVKPN